MINRILAGRYQLLSEEGQGGMSIVYKALDRKWNRMVAVKVLKSEHNANKEYVGRFQREAEAATMVKHPNIVEMLDVGIDREDRFLVMEFIEGKNLKDLIQEKGTLSPQNAVDITLRILSALQAAHDKGIIHRDIKPQNVLISEQGIVKVADFGIARIVTMGTLGSGEYVMGTIHYLPPERAVSNGVTTPQSDLYCVGVVLYEMLTGHMPFDGDNPGAILTQLLQGTPRPIWDFAPGTPPALAEVVRIAMAKRMDQRFLSAAAFAADIQNAMSGKPLQFRPMIPATSHPVARPPSPTPAKPTRARGRPSVLSDAKPRSRRFNRWMNAAIVAAVIGLIIVIYNVANNVYDEVVNNVRVPDVERQTLEDAQRTLDRLGLNYTVSEVNTTVSEGIVVLQAPKPDDMLRKGDTVTLTVSKGPVSQSVPRLVGLTTQAAIGVIQQSGLTMSVMERVVSAEQVDVILTQSPEEGAAYQPGDMVQVTVSGGSAFVPILRGKTLTEAQELVVSAKLVLNTVMSYTETTDASLHGTVASQTPAADGQVVEGTMVSVTVYQYPALAIDGQVQLSLPESDTPLQVRVTLVEKEVEREVYSDFHQPGTTRNPIITITAQEAGRYTYRVYIGGQFAYQQQVMVE